MGHVTTNATLPPEVAKEYELTQDLPGGPAFDYPHVRGAGTVDYSKLTLQRAANLVSHGLPHLRKRAASEPTPEAAAPRSTPEPAASRKAAPAPD